MERLVCLPSRSEYAATDSAAGYLRVQLDGGAGRYRADIRRTSKVVDCSWTLTKELYNYMLAFYRRFKVSGEPFYINLVINDFCLENCKAWFIPGTFQQGRISGNAHFVTAQLEVITPPQTAAESVYDELLVGSYSYFGKNPWYYMDLLNDIMNRQLPLIMTYPRK